MKHILGLVALVLHAGSAFAAGTYVPATDPALDFRPALGKQIDVRFSEAFAKDRLPMRDIAGVIVYEVQDATICLFGRGKGLEPESPALATFARQESGDICVPRADVEVGMPALPASGAPMPFYSTDKSSCAWSWKTGRGIGLWTEDCTFDTGRWDVAYDEANDLFALRVDAGNSFPVLRQFRKNGGPEALLPELKAKGLVLDDAECVFEKAAGQPVPKGWTAWQVMPTGKRKEAFAQPSDEIPEPPCGELGSRGGLCRLLHGGRCQA